MNCILMVAGDPAILILTKMILSAEGYEVHAASNGIEAFECVQEIAPSVAVLDLQMPFTNGPTFFREIDGPTRPPVVIMSAFGAEHAWGGLGAEACISKPYNPACLIRIVNVLRDSA